MHNLRKVGALSHRLTHVVAYGSTTHANSGSCQLTSRMWVKPCGTHQCTSLPWAGMVDAWTGEPMLAYISSLNYHRHSSSCTTPQPAASILACVVIILWCKQAADGQATIGINGISTSQYATLDISGCATLRVALVYGGVGRQGLCLVQTTVSRQLVSQLSASSSYRCVQAVPLALKAVTVVPQQQQQNSSCRGSSNGSSRSLLARVPCIRHDKGVCVATQRLMVCL